MNAKKEERVTGIEISQMKENRYMWSCRDGNRLRLEINEEEIFSISYE